MPPKSTSIFTPNREPTLVVILPIAAFIIQYCTNETPTVPGIRNLLIVVLRTLGLKWVHIAKVTNTAESTARGIFNKIITQKKPTFNFYYQWTQSESTTNEVVQKAYDHFLNKKKNPGHPTFFQLRKYLRGKKVGVTSRRLYQILTELGLSLKRPDTIARPNNPEVAKDRLVGADELLEDFDKMEKGEIFGLFQDETGVCPVDFTQHNHISQIGEPAFCNSIQFKRDPTKTSATIFISRYGIVYFDTMDVQYNTTEFIYDVDCTLKNLQQHTEWHNAKEIVFYWDRASFHKSKELNAWFKGRTISVPPQYIKPGMVVDKPVRYKLLPAYSPNMNPVENVNSSLKAALNELIHDYDHVLDYDELEDLVRGQLKVMTEPEEGFHKLYQHTKEYCQALKLNEGYCKEIGKHLRELKKKRTSILGEPIIPPAVAVPQRR